MVLSNANGHTIPFVITEDNADVQDFVLPGLASLTQWAEEAAETWEDAADLADFIDFNIEQIRVNEALAKAAADKAAFATKTSKGHKANVEYRRGLIEAALNAAVSRGLVKEPKVKSNTYTVGIQDTAGSLETERQLESFTDAIQCQLDLLSAALLAQVLQGAPIALNDADIFCLSELSTYYVENYGSATNKDIACLEVTTKVVLAKSYIKQAVKNNWLTDKLAKAFSIVKGKALTIRM